MFYILMVIVMKKKFSILVASKDNAEHLKNFLESLLKNGYFAKRNVEVIIVDNASKTSQVKNVCNNYPVNYVFEPAVGKSNALNKGLTLCSGEYVVFTDDDVIIDDTRWLEKLYSCFQKSKHIAYVSGNVVAYEKRTSSQKSWEKKGGLSKGVADKFFTKKYLSSFNFLPWPLTKICAGANCMIKKEALLKVGGFNKYFGPGAVIGHGESLLIGYELMRKGYELYYSSQACVLHKHPKTSGELKKKLFLYATGDTGIHMFLFFKYLDFRSLMWACGGHQIYVFKNLMNWFIGKYHLPPKYTIHSLLGSFFGTIKFLYLLLLRKIRMK